MIKGRPCFMDLAEFRALGCVYGEPSPLERWQSGLSDRQSERVGNIQMPQYLMSSSQRVFSLCGLQTLVCCFP